MTKLEGRNSRYPFRISISHPIVFPNLDVLAFVSGRLAASVIRGDFLSAANETKIPDFRGLDRCCLPTDGESGAGEQIAPNFLDRLLRRRYRRIRRQHGSIPGIVRHGFVDVFAGSGFGPGIIGVAHRLFGFVVAGETRSLLR